MRDFEIVVCLLHLPHCEIVVCLLHLQHCEIEVCLVHWQPLRNSGVFVTFVTLRNSGVFVTFTTLQNSGVFVTFTTLRNSGVFVTFATLQNSGVFVTFNTLRNSGVFVTFTTLRNTVVVCLLHRQPLRNDDGIRLPTSRLNQFNNFPLYIISPLWSAFDQEDIKIHHNTILFNNLLKQYFLSKLDESYQCSRLLCQQCHLNLNLKKFQIKRK